MSDLISETPMYLVPVTDPDRITAARRELGLTDEVIEQRKKEFRNSLAEYKRRHSELQPDSDNS
ncbi:MAG: hypothetical protein LKI24_10630 [Acidipropionibacterium sp.]|jgi:hypothetical protein|nr:hypothetical protein [Acidipropionibacterium sp.]